MEIRYCDCCHRTIPETRKRGAKYCTNKHGWTFRNNLNAEKRKEMLNSELGLFKNRKILQDIVDKEIFDISKETATVLKFDFNCFTGIIITDTQLRTTEYKLFEYSYTICGDRIKIKKIV